MSNQPINNSEVVEKPRRKDNSIDLHVKWSDVNGHQHSTAETTPKRGFALDDDAVLEALHSKPNAKSTLLPSDQPTTHSQQLADHKTLPLDSTQMFTQRGKDGETTSTEALLVKDDEDHRVSPSHFDGKTSPSTTDRLKRKDSVPVIVCDFDQIERHLEDKSTADKPDEEGSSPLMSTDKLNAGFMTPSKPMATSKFAPEHMRKSSNQPAPTKNSRKIVPIDMNKVPTSSKDDYGPPEPSSPDLKYAKRTWSKLSYVFQSMLLFKRQEVKNINDPAAIHDEIDAFQIRKWRDKPTRGWDISKQDFAREAFQNIRRVQLFCECATVGSKRHLDYMKELIMTDPKKYMVEPDDPHFILNHKNNMGHTPLYIASKNGNLGVVRLLVESKANYMIKSKICFEETADELPIHVAVRWGHATIVEYFLNTCVYGENVLQECFSQAPNQYIKTMLGKHLGKKVGGGGIKSLFRCFAP